MAEASADASDAPKVNKSCMTYIPLSFIIIGADHFREGLGLRGKNRKGGYSKSLQLNSVGPDRLDRLADNDDDVDGKSFTPNIVYYTQLSEFVQLLTLTFSSDIHNNTALRFTTAKHHQGTKKHECP